MRLCLAIVATFAAAPALAQVSPFDGEYGYPDIDGCVVEGYTTCPAVRVEGGRFFGEESACDLVPVAPVPGMNAAVYDMNCSGEGDTWQVRALFHRDLYGILTMTTQDGSWNYLPAQSSAAPAPSGK